MARGRHMNTEFGVSWAPGILPFMGLGDHSMVVDVLVVVGAISLTITAITMGVKIVGWLGFFEWFNQKHQPSPLVSDHRIDLIQAGLNDLRVMVDENSMFTGEIVQNLRTPRTPIPEKLALAPAKKAAIENIDMNPEVEEFFNSNVMPDANSQIKASEFFAEYKKRIPLSIQVSRADFYRATTKRFTKKVRGTGTFYTGIRLSPAAGSLTSIRGGKS